MTTESQIITNPACRGAASGEAGSPSAQKNLFMQNKPNLPDAQMNISTAMTMDYVNIRLRSRFKNKAKQTQFKANQTQFYTICAENKPNQTQFAGCSNERKFCDGGNTG